MSVPDYRRFTLVVKLNRAEREALRALAAREHLPSATLVRRLIWQAQKNEVREWSN